MKDKKLSSNSPYLSLATKTNIVISTIYALEQCEEEATVGRVVEEAKKLGIQRKTTIDIIKLLEKNGDIKESGTVGKHF